jgi:type IV pilus assembly protein PilQ
MSSKKTRTPRDLVRLSGRLPALAAAALMAAVMAAPAWSQPPAAKPAKKEGEGPQVKVSEHMTVDLHVKDEDLGAVLELLSIQTQKNIVSSKNVSARVTATLYGVTFKEALDALLHVNGCGYIEQGNFIYVYTLPELEEIQKALKKQLAKTIWLNYLNATDAAAFVKPLLSKEGSVQMSAKTEAFTLPGNSPVGKDDYALSATLVIFDYEENIAAVEALIAELDTKPAQVLVDATVLQTSLNDANAWGVDFTILGDMSFLDFMSVGGPKSVVDALIKGGDGSDPQKGFSPPDDRGGGIVSSPGNTEGRSTFKLGIITDDVSVFVKMLDEVSDTVIVSHPRILALNRQPSRVLVGRRVGYLNTTATETSTTQTVEFLDTGTQLYFRPFVAKDNSIRMELKPQVSEAILRDQTTSTGSVVTIPDELTNEIVTNVIVKDGQTIVLGGLFRESSSFTRRQVPLLGDIPLVGAAFRGHDTEVNRSEIIFMITPTIINDTIVANAAMRVSDDIERLQAGSRQALLPWSREKMSGALNLEAERFARNGEYEKALWNIQRSLSINPIQPDALRLREKITSEREVWPDQCLLNNALNADIQRRLDRVPTPTEEQPHYNPDRSFDVPREKVEAGGARTDLGPVTEPFTWGSPRPGDAWRTGPGAEPTPEPTDAMGQDPTGATADPAAAAGQSQPLVSVNAENERLDAVLRTLSQQTRRNFIAGQAIQSQRISATVNNAPMADALNTILAANGFGYVTRGNFIYIYALKDTEATGRAMTTRTAGPNAADAAAETAAAPAVDPAAEAEACRPAVVQLLGSLQDQIRLYRAANGGHWPILGMDPNTGWDPLLSSAIISEPPVNPWIHGPFATDVVLGSAPDTEYHTDYGWIFNPETGELWAAGCDATGRPFPRTTATARAGQPLPADATLPEVRQRPSGGISTFYQNLKPTTPATKTAPASKPVATAEGGR